ncbi:oxysterol binding family protein, member 7 [Planoprotostelium fungivorum]|uniref:Oxysterol binding family protein, member 7 n=1 Tax=Planoprotostelium fungivorum TaxID=1890364 RepID=A0A2P6N1X4_9EUKA|nr:oxysterol binding family protein, member 7 [Planoprotostelium fungivorum]
MESVYNTLASLEQHQSSKPRVCTEAPGVYDGSLTASRSSSLLSSHTRDLYIVMEKVPGTEAISYIEQQGEWRTRKITLFGVVRSLLSDLKIGQDMTRVSLPATLLYPFSMLEVFSARELGVFHLLFDLNKIEDPYQRMLQVVRWSLGFIQKESWHKKPYNPVLGETLETWNETKTSGRSEFIGEQVSHHPPVSAFIIKNEQENITLDCNISFGVKFGNNIVTIVTEGSGFINLDRRNEQYELVRKTPGMVIKNVIWGTRKMYWAGEVCITCPKTGYTVNLSFKESGSENVVTGSVTQTDAEGNEEEMCKIEGKCGGEVHMFEKGRKDFFFDAGRIDKPVTHYKKWEELEPLSSQQVWADVNKYSIADDMPNADASKKEVEQAQRERSTAKKQNGEENLAKFFEQSESAKIWVYKNKRKLTGGAPMPIPQALSGPLPVPVNNSNVVPSNSYPPSNQTNTLQSYSSNPSSLNLSGTLVTGSTSSAAILPMSVGSSGHVIGHPDDTVLAHSSNPHVVNYLANMGHSTSALPTVTSTIGSPGEEEIKRKHTGGNKLPLRHTTQITDKSPKTLPKDIARLSDDVNIITGQVKMRNSMKIWINRFFALRPGRLIYFKDDREMLKGRCTGIIRLADCHIRTRPTHKDGFSFKIWHSMNYPIYNKYGLKGETLKMAKLPVGYNYCILRVGSEQERKAWMDAIEAQIDYANTYDPNPGRGALLEDVVDSEEDVVDRRETMEELNAKNEEFQRALLDGLSNQQRTNSQNIQSQTIQQMQNWKMEVDTKLVNMEKRIMASISGGKDDGRVKLSYVQLFVVLMLAFLIARFV